MGNLCLSQNADPLPEKKKSVKLALPNSHSLPVAVITTPNDLMPTPTALLPTDPLTLGNPLPTALLPTTALTTSTTLTTKALGTPTTLTNKKPLTETYDRLLSMPT